MKLLGTLLLSLSLTTTVAVAGHSLKEGHAMIDYGAVYMDKVIVKIKDDVPFEFGSDQQSLILRPDSADLQAFRVSSAIPHTMTRLFKSLEEEFTADKLAGEPADRLAGYISLDFAAPLQAADAKAVLDELFGRNDVEFAYFKAIETPATLTERTPTADRDTDNSQGNYPAPAPAAALSSASPDFQDRQFYLKPAPDGVDAFAGWQQPGGDGKGVYVVDIEWGWQDNHEDFKKPFWMLAQARDRWVDHGTAVWGIIAAKKDGSGVTGIAHGAEMGTGKYERSPDTYMQVAKRLQKEKVGVIVIEQQIRGPDRGKYCPNEYEEASFDAFKKITSEMGIHIIAASGNGNSNLDGSAYDGAFDQSKRDSGAILIGAGAPPGRNHLTRLNFSNYGSRIDAMGYGRNVVTTGYGGLHGKGNKTKEYTAEFSGTSSATPIVTGAAVSILGMAMAKNQTISLDNLRKALRATGTKQKGNTSRERIGNLPSIPEMVQYFNQNGWE